MKDIRLFASNNNNKHHYHYSTSSSRKRPSAATASQSRDLTMIMEEKATIDSQRKLAFHNEKSDCLPIISNSNNDESSTDVYSEIPSSSETPLSFFIVQVTVIASLGGILFGYDLGVISGALPQLQQTFDLSFQQQELVVSILYVGGLIGASVGGALCDAFGRKRAILLTDIVFAAGAFVLYSAPTVSAVVIGRVAVGFGVAVSGIADVSYLHEIAPPQWRGSIVSVNEACISLGFLLAFAAGALWAADDGAQEPPGGWRLMFGASGWIAMIQFVGMWNMPESPIWLREQGRLEESELALRRIHSSRSLRDEDETHVSQPSPHRRPGTNPSYDAIISPANRSEQSSSSRVDSVTESPPISISGAHWNGGICSRITSMYSQFVYLLKQLHSFAVTTMTYYRRQAYIALFLSVTQQFCGQTNVLSYAPTIFASAGNASNQSSKWSTLSIGLVKFAVTVLVIWKVERIGRRFLLLSGMCTIAIGLLLVTMAFSGTAPSSANASDGLDHVNGHAFDLALPGVWLVVCGYSASFGPMTWLLTSELFPTDIRGRALGASTIVTYMCAALVTSTFLTAQQWIGASTVFAIYLLVTVFGIIFAYLAIPDTKEKDVTEIGNDLDKLFWWKRHTRGANDDGESESTLFSSVQLSGHVHELNIT